MTVTIQTGTTERPPRVLLLGVPKIGKSTFACQWPKPIVIPMAGEEGIDDLDVPHYNTCQTYDQVIECLVDLTNRRGEYQTVVIDSLSALEPLIWEKVCQEGKKANIEDFGYGKGYTFALDRWAKIRAGLDVLRGQGVASILIGHVKVKTFNDPLCDPYDNYLLDIHSAALAGIERWCDCVWFANRKVAVRKIADPKRTDKVEAVHAVDLSEGKPVLLTQKRAAHPGGGRGAWGHLSYELPLNFAAVVNDYENVAKPAFREYQKGLR